MINTTSSTYGTRAWVEVIADRNRDAMAAELLPLGLELTSSRIILATWSLLVGEVRFDLSSEAARTHFAELYAQWRTTGTLPAPRPLQRHIVITEHEETDEFLNAAAAVMQQHAVEAATEMLTRNPVVNEAGSNDPAFGLWDGIELTAASFHPLELMDLLEEFAAAEDFELSFYQCTYREHPDTVKLAATWAAFDAEVNPS